MRASRKQAEAAPAPAARAERVVEEAAEGVDAFVVASAATQSAVLETVAVAVDAAAGETLSDEPKKRGRGRPKKARTEAEQRFVDLKAKKRAAPSAPFETTGAADEENAGASVASVGVGFSLKSLIVAAGVSKSGPRWARPDANASDAAKAKETEHPPAARKRRRLAGPSRRSAT